MGTRSYVVEVDERREYAFIVKVDRAAVEALLSPGAIVALQEDGGLRYLKPVIRLMADNAMSTSDTVRDVRLVGPTNIQGGLAAH